MSLSSRNYPPALLSILALALIVPACTSSYIPRNQGRVAMVMKDGAIAYARDGHVHKHGFLGGGLIDAVRGVPRAERAARTFRSRMGWGLAGMLGGLVCSTVALAYSVDGANESNSDQTRKAALTSLACLGITAVGAGFAISGAPYQYDAINLFNDSAAPVGPVYLPGQAPGVVPPASRGY